MPAPSLASLARPPQVPPGDAAKPSPPAPLAGRIRVVEGEVELEDVDAGLAQEPEGAAVGVVVDERQHLVELEAALVGHASGLEPGVGDRDVRVEARARRR